MSAQRTSPPAPAIILGGDSIALTVARNLGRRGIPVYLLDVSDSYARQSRYVRWLEAGNEPDLAKRWAGWLLETGVKELEGAVILPGGDDGLEVIAAHRKELEKKFSVLEANDELLKTMINKRATYDLCRTLGFEVPLVFDVTSRTELQSRMDEIRFPCALKPTHSYISHRYFPFEKLFHAASGDELLRQYDRLHRHDVDCILTEIIPQIPEGYFSYHSYIDAAGNPLLHFTKRKIRQYPNLYGFGTHHMTTWDRDVAAEGLRFFKAVGLRGIGSVEFMRDPRDGALKFIECNARFTLTTRIQEAAGIDLPLLAYNRTAGLAGPAVGRYRQGVRLTRLSADVMAFRELNRVGKLSLWQWLRSILRPQPAIYFSWRDPMPMLSKAWPFVLWQLKKITGRVQPLVTAGAPNGRPGEARP